MFLLPRVHRREGDVGHIHFVVVGCVSIVGIQDIASNLTRASVNCEIFTLYIRNELHFNFSHRCNNQLELQRSSNAQNAQLDKNCFSQVSSNSPVRSKAQEDKAPVDDGHAINGCPLSPLRSPRANAAAASTATAVVSSLSSTFPTRSGNQYKQWF